MVLPLVINHVFHKKRLSTPILGHLIFSILQYFRFKKPCKRANQEQLYSFAGLELEIRLINKGEKSDKNYRREKTRGAMWENSAKSRSATALECHEMLRRLWESQRLRRRNPAEHKRPDSRNSVLPSAITVNNLTLLHFPIETSTNLLITRMDARNN